jgi:Secretion system C-terminal sorting domain
MIKKLSVLFVAMAFISTAFAQEVVKQKAPLRTDEGTTAFQSYLPLGNNSPVTAANYVAVDTMANSFGPAANTLNPLALDPYSNVLAVVHRGKTPYAVSSGELWWNYSTDLGISWQRSNTSVQNGTTATNAGRYPSMTIANYTNSINMADLLGAFSWPELNPSAFGYLGYGVSEGLLESAYAHIDQGPPAYGANVPTFSDDAWIFWCAANLSDNSIRLWRTQDYSAVEIIDPPTWGAARWTNGNILLGGVSHNGVVYVGVIGSYTEEIGAGGWEIGYSKSTDHGATWSDWFVPDWRTIPGLSNFTELWDWKVGDAFVSYSGDIQVDSNGRVHFVTGLTDSVTATYAIVEIYETAPNVWAGKVITAAHDKSKYGYEANTPGLGQTGPSIMMAANKQRDFFAVQYSLGSPETQDSLCDLYVHTRALADANWSGSTNLTETNTMNEDGCHLAPYMATSGGSDYVFSMFWYEAGNTTPIINQTGPSVIYVAPFAVRTAGSDIPITFQVDMSTQIFEGNFPAGANVVVRGSFQSDFGDPGGNWQGNLYQLSDPDSDEIYTATFNAPSSLAGNNYAFKYVIVNPPASDNWESTPDRPFTVTAPATTLPVMWFNNDSVFIPEFEVTNTLNFTADISSILGVGLGGAFDPNQDSLLVMGLDWDNYGKHIIGNRKMVTPDPFNPGIYKTTLTVTSGSAAPYGVGDSTNWKFKAFPDTRFANGGWETGPDRWHVYQADGTIVTLPIIVPRIQPKFNGTTIPIDLSINVDMLGAVNRYNGLPIPLSSLEFVGMRGGADFLGNWNNGGCWCVNDTLTGHMKVLTQVSQYIWRYHTILPIGISAEVYEYKFAAMYPGADTLNSGINPLDNEGGFGWNHILSINNTSPIVRNHYFGSSDPGNVERIDNLIPTDYKLEQNYPNPFNPTTKIRYSIPSVGTRHSASGGLFVQLKVYDVLGREVATLVDAEQPAGVYEAAFDASNLSSGIYFYSLQTREHKFTRKMMLLK